MRLVPAVARIPLHVAGAALLASVLLGCPAAAAQVDLRAATAVSAGVEPKVRPVVLDGRSLTLAQVVEVARAGLPVAVTDEAWRRVERSHVLLLEYARLGKPVYGLNRGVGQNKDQTIFEGDAVSPAARTLSERFNRNMLLSHTVAYGEPAPEDAVRAAMLIRLNTALFGGTGMQPAVVRQYAEFINRGLTPVVLSQGSTGQADITILPQIGLAMMGEGEITYRGERLPASQALQRAGLQPVQPYAKDALSILSSNAYGAALAVLASADAARLLAQADAVAALSLEGLDGNVAPFLAHTQAQRPYDGQQRSAARVLSFLQGSALWQVDDKRALQDPLSFRTASQVHGAALDCVNVLERQLRIQINSSDDNPTVALDVAPAAGATPQERRYYVTSGAVQGAVFPSAGFDPTAWVVPLQGLGVALSHVAQSSAQRVLRLGDPAITGLSRFLTPGAGALAFTTIQKPVSSLVTEIRALSHPVSSDSLVLAGDIEDTGTNAPLVAQRVTGQLRRLRMLLGIELMHAAQAVDLRRRADPQRALGAGTERVLTGLREQVAFLSQDRRLDVDIAGADRFLRSAPDFR